MDWQTAFNLAGSVDPNVIRRTADNAFIPNDPLNMDWLAYEAWLAEGNTPLPPEGDTMTSPHHDKLD